MYEVTYKVRFQHCDPAGIVFFPRYFEMINAVVEDWFADIVQCDFHRMHQELGAGVPTVNLNTDFMAPSRQGDQLTFALTPTRVGGTSLTLDITAHCESEQRLRNQSTLVYIDLNTGKPQRWPDAMRTNFTGSKA